MSEVLTQVVNESILKGHFPPSVMECLIGLLFKEGDRRRLSVCTGVHSIVKLNTTCNKKNLLFYIEDHQNRSTFFIFFPHE